MAEVGFQGLQFADENEKTEHTTRSLATASDTAVTPHAPADTPLYDEQQAQQILERALQMQVEHKHRLSAEQIVRLGEEAHVAPEFVLRALAETGDEAATQTTPSSASQTVVAVAATPETRHTHTSARLRPLSHTARTAAVLVPLLYSAFSFLVFRDPTYGLHPGPDNLSDALLLFFGPLVTVYLGWRLHSKRLGFLSGLLMGWGLGVAVAIVNYAANRSSFLDLLELALPFGACGAALGTLAAFIQRHGLALYRRLAAAFLRLFPGLADV